MPRTLRHSLVVVQSGQLPVDQEAYLVREIPMNIVVVLAAVFFVCRLLVMGNVIDGIWGDILNITWILTSMAFYFRLAYLMAERNVRVSETLKRLGASSFVIFAMHSLINGRISSVCFSW